MGTIQVVNTEMRGHTKIYLITTGWRIPADKKVGTTVLKLLIWGRISLVLWSHI